MCPDGSKLAVALDKDFFANKMSEATRSNKTLDVAHEDAIRQLNEAVEESKNDEKPVKLPRAITKCEDLVKLLQASICGNGMARTVFVAVDGSFAMFKYIHDDPDNPQAKFLDDIELQANIAGVIGLIIGVDASIKMDNDAEVVLRLAVKQNHSLEEPLVKIFRAISGVEKVVSSVTFESIGTEMADKLSMCFDISTLRDLSAKADQLVFERFYFSFDVQPALSLAGESKLRFRGCDFQQDGQPLLSGARRYGGSFDPPLDLHLHDGEFASLFQHLGRAVEDKRLGSLVLDGNRSLKNKDQLSAFAKLAEFCGANNCPLTLVIDDNNQLNQEFSGDKLRNYLSQKLEHSVTATTGGEATKSKGNKPESTTSFQQYYEERSDDDYHFGWVYGNFVPCNRLKKGMTSLCNHCKSMMMKRISKDGSGSDFYCKNHKKKPFLIADPVECPDDAKRFT